jgi:Tol biopolymer transport system component
VNNRALNLEFPAVSLDGKFLAYTDYNANANIVIRNLTTGLDQQVTNDGEAPGKEVREKVFSPDNKHLAYSFDSWELRLIELGTPAFATPRLLFRREGVSFVTPYNFSADGRRLSVQAFRARQTAQVGYLTVGDGEFHVIRSIDWRGSSRLSLSPDGTYLAYDRLSDEDAAPDLFVVSTDGKQEVPIARHRGRDAVVGWSADGRYLLFTSEKDGTNDLWAQQMRNGRPTGAAMRLRAGVSPDPVGVTSKGDVYFSVNPSTEAFTLQRSIPRPARRGRRPQDLLLEHGPTGRRTVPPSRTPYREAAP